MWKKIIVFEGKSLFNLNKKIVMKRLSYAVLTLLSSVGIAHAQNARITGTVLSAEDGEPIIGASIIVKGTTTGTVTNFDGSFSLDVPQSAKTLMISYIGMRSQEVAIKPTLQVRLMADTQNLDEVVVTAMGISKEKKALGYAVQDVKGEQLTQGANTSLTGALQGKVSGIDFTPSSGMPGASSKMTIRGSRSFTGDNTPLYVVDGMPIASTSDYDTGNSTSGTDNANRSFDIDLSFRVRIHACRHSKGRYRNDEDVVQFDCGHREREIVGEVWGSHTERDILQDQPGHCQLYQQTAGCQHEDIP